MAIVKSSALIRRPREVVFDSLSDPRGELEWNPKVQRMELIGEGPIGAGSRFNAKWKMSEPMIMQITRYDRPNGWTFSNGGSISVELDIDLQDSADGTLLSAQFNAIPHGFARLFFPIFLLMMRKEERQNMGHLTKWLEAQAPNSHR